MNSLLKPQKLWYRLHSSKSCLTNLSNEIKTASKNLNLTEELFKNIFAAKRVPLAFLDNFEILREQNREDWEVVRQTISHDEETKDYDFYFDFVKDLIEPFRTHEDKKDSSEDQIQ